MEDRAVQELPSRYTGGFDCKDSCLSTTLDTRLQSSEVKGIKRVSL